MPPARAHDDAVFAKILEESRVGRFTVPIANLEHTSMGRPLHADGIKSIRDSITAQGWMGSKMTVCLVGSLPDGELTEDAAAGQQYRVIDGNHRLAALLELQEANKAAEPPVASADAVEVEVHAGLSPDTERLIASSLNVVTELVVKTTLSDRVVWYKAWHDEIQSKHKGKNPLSSNAVSTRFIADSKKVGKASQSIPTVKKFMKIVQAMKPRALAALYDVTHLPGRHVGHHDRGTTKAVPSKLLHSRVTAVSLERQQFADLTDREQEAYIYRLASVEAFPGVVTPETFLKLDQMAKDVARMVDGAERHLGPVSRWSEDFRMFVAKSRNYEGSAKFVTHYNSQAAAAETYKRKLPDGMAADVKYMEWIKSLPWSPLVVLIHGSEDAPHPMRDIYDAYIKSKEDWKADAAAAEGLFKTQLAAKVKIATDAAAAAKAAKDAAELEKTTAAAAKSAKEAAAVSMNTAANAIATPAVAAGTDTSASPATAAPDVAAAGPAASSSSAVLPKTSSATTTSEAGDNAKGSIATQLADKKRKAERDDATKDRRKKARSFMSKLVGLDLLAPSFNAETPIHHSTGTPIMLAFLNVAANPEVVTRDDDAVLRKALMFLGGNLSVRGTVVVALPDTEFCRPKLRAVFSAAGLILEDHPVISVYQHGKSGRPARKDKLVYPPQSSIAVLAHKSANFICNGGGPRSGGEASSRTSVRGASVQHPRTIELDRVGVVVSLGHPPAGTFLAESTADLLIKRFSDVGDSVLVSGGLRDAPLVSAALLQGRVSIVLEPEASKLSDTAEKLDTLTGSASRDGMWARMLKVSEPLVTVGPSQLPRMVPASNVPTSTEREVAQLLESGSDDPERAVAEKTAALHGLLIKGAAESCGLFAAKRLEDSPGVFLKMPLVGSFEVHDSEDDSVEAQKKDGLPRFLVSSTMSMFLSAFEVARPNAGLYLVPAKTSPLYYLKRSGTDDASKQNFTFSAVLTSRGFRAVEDKEAHLKNAMNSIMFGVKSTIEKDHEVHCCSSLTDNTVVVV